MGELVRHYLGPGGVPPDHGRREEHHPGVLHPTVRETGRKNQKVESFPLVGPEQRLADPDHFLRAGELPGSGVQQGGTTLGVDPGPGADVAEADIPGGEGEEVGGDGLVHGELLDDAVLGAPEGIGAGGARLTSDGVSAGEVGGSHDGREGAR